VSDNDTDQSPEEQAEQSNGPASQPIPPEPAVASVYVTGASAYIDDDGMARIEWLEMNACGQTLLARRHPHDPGELHQPAAARRSQPAEVPGANAGKGRGGHEATGRANHPPDQQRDRARMTSAATS